MILVRTRALVVTAEPNPAGGWDITWGTDTIETITTAEFDRRFDPILPGHHTGRGVSQ